MTDLQKFWKALLNIKSDVECTIAINVMTEEYFNNNIEWKTGVDSNGITTSTTTNPHSEITWTKVKEEMDKL